MRWIAAVLVLVCLLAGGAQAASTCRVYALFDNMGMLFGPLPARYQVQGDRIWLETGPEDDPTRPSSPVTVAAEVPPQVRRKAPAGTFMIGRNRAAWYFFTR